MSATTLIRLGESTTFVALPANYGVEIEPLEEDAETRWPPFYPSPQTVFSPARRYRGFRTFHTGSRWARGERLPAGTTVRVRSDQKTVDITLS